MVVHRFGPFELDPATRRLLREAKPVRLSTPQSAILTHLVAHAGEVVSKDALMAAGWGRAAITDNSLVQSIARLRKVLGGSRRSGAVQIETLPSHGYRFNAIVQRVERHSPDSGIEAQLEPYLAFVHGQTQLDTLDCAAIQRARQVFEEVLRQAPDYARAHTGLGMACGLAFEAGAVDQRRNTAALEAGISHARRACELAPGSGEAWSTLAFLLGLSGQTGQAVAAANKAVAIEPENWRHALRLAYVSWGEERVQAARRVLTLCPALALAHWLRTTVFIARGALEMALDEVRLGCAAQDAQAKGSGFPGIGLHLLHGLVLAAQDHLDDGVAEFRKELSWAESGQLYARECAANTWYALACVHLRQKRRDEANAAFARALAIAPCHVSATAALHGRVPASACGIEAAVGQAIVLARGNRHADAARVYREALVQSPAGSAGWLLPVEPLLHPLARPAIWAETLGIVRVRAT